MHVLGTSELSSCSSCCELGEYRRWPSSCTSCASWRPSRTTGLGEKVGYGGCTLKSLDGVSTWSRYGTSGNTPWEKAPRQLNQIFPVDWIYLSQHRGFHSRIIDAPVSSKNLHRIHVHPFKTTTAMSPTTTTSLQILVVILYASHIFGCLWWVTSRYDDDDSWWERDGLNRDDARSTYIASLYWAATTITTVSLVFAH